jgi:hypothetical protein
VLMLISFAIGFIPRVASGTPASKRLP